MPGAAPVICFDFDGTLVDVDGRIHPDDVAVLADPERHGATFVPATGRPLHSVRHVLGEHGLAGDGALPFALVLENGAAVYDPGEVLRARQGFDDATRDGFLAGMLEAPAITFLLHNADIVRVLHPHPAGDRMVARFALQTEPFDAGRHAGEPLSKVVSVAETAEPLRAFADATAELPAERAFSLPTVLEFNARGIDKGAGLAALLAERPAGTPVVVIGDGENDVPMFGYADRTIVPDDAPEAIRALADQLLDVRERGILIPALEVARSL